MSLIIYLLINSILLNLSLHDVCCFWLFGCGCEPAEVPREADRKRGPRRDDTAGVGISGPAVLESYRG